MIAIVGAGISGLTAGFYLQKRGIPVAIYEASSRAGGLIGTSDNEGFLVEHGPNTIMANSAAVPRLVRDLGLESRRLAPSESANTRYIVRNGALAKVPMSLPGAVGTELLSFSSKMRVLREPFIARTSKLDESLAAFVRRRLGREFLDHLIDPFVAGVYAGDPEQLSLTHALPRMAALEQRWGSLIKGAVLGAGERKQRNAELASEPGSEAKMFSFDRGLGVLTETLAAHLNGSIRLNCPVRAIEPEGDNWNVWSAAGRESFHSVLFTLPAHQLTAIGMPHGGRTGGAEITAELKKFEQVYYPPIARLGFGFRRSQVAHALDGFGGLVPRCERMNILGVLFSSSMFPNRAPEGHLLLTAFAGGARQPALLHLSAREIAELALHDLEKLLGISGRPVFSDVALIENSIPQYNVGYGAVKDLIRRMEIRYPGLYFSGSFNHGISVSDCISGGASAAQRLALELANPRKAAFDEVAHA